METDKEQQVAAAFPQPFSIVRSARLRSPFIFGSPHSGRHYPQHFLEASRLDAETLRRSEDFYVDELLTEVTALGGVLIHAHFPRAYLDVNREPFELDPLLIADRLPRFANTRSLRVAGGLGTVPRVVTEGRNIYAHPISLAEVTARIKRLYKPYHDALAQLLDEACQQFGHAVLIDCHSMPSQAAVDRSGRAVDFVLGDRFGTSCSPLLIRFVRDRLLAQGYRVALNKPYAGGYITEKYGDPRARRHAMQIEINRALYMDEDSFRKRRRFAALRADLTELARALLDELPGALSAHRAAAE